MALLFVIELQDFLSVQVSEELFVDTTRIPNMTIKFDITFARIACPCEFLDIYSNYLELKFSCFSVLSVDAIDSSGEQQIGVEHNIFKRRLDLQGKPLQEAELDTLNKNHNKTEDPTTEAASLKICKSCYGAADGCCDTCADVREAYRKKNWAFNPDNFEQCLAEKNFTRDSSAFKEGCQIYGYLEVNRVGGSFHIAPGKSYSVNHVHGTSSFIFFLRL